MSTEQQVSFHPAKGQNELMRSTAQALGQSMGAFIRDAVAAHIERCRAHPDFRRKLEELRSSLQAQLDQL